MDLGENDGAFDGAVACACVHGTGPVFGPGDGFFVLVVGKSIFQVSREARLREVEVACVREEGFQTSGQATATVLGGCLFG